MFASVPVVAQAAVDDGSKRMVTVPVNGAAIDVRPVFLPFALMGRSCPEKIETVSRH